MDARAPGVHEHGGAVRIARPGRTETVMKRAASVIGVALIVLGVALIPIGLGVLKLGPMAGHIIWTGWGSVSVAFGAGFLVWANRERPAP